MLKLKVLQEQGNNDEDAELLTTTFVLLGNCRIETPEPGGHASVHKGGGRGAVLTGGWRGPSLWLSPCRSQACRKADSCTLGIVASTYLTGNPAYGKANLHSTVERKTPSPWKGHCQELSICIFQYSWNPSNSVQSLHTKPFALLKPMQTPCCFPFYLASLSQPDSESCAVNLWVPPLLSEGSSSSVHSTLPNWLQLSA